MYLIVTAIKWLSILFLTQKLKREIRMKARIGQTANQRDDSE